VKIKKGQKSFWVVNFHGVSRPGEKFDTPRRLLQSKKIISALKKLKGPKILCGDFNLLPNTKSIELVEQAGMKNLIKTYKIKNTRNSISWQKYNNKQYYADFTFVSPEIKVKKFKVPYNLPSDHLPMILDFEV
jgi:endonuclease/exonuclease/phosphatase family metal-dependent hydrolase